MENFKNSINILLVEDNPADAELALEAFKQWQLFLNVQIKQNAMEALHYLRTQAAKLPDLILLDLNLPRWDGKSLLKEIKFDQTLKKIPVIVLTTSDAKQDVEECYNLHANGYIVKSLDIDQYFKKIKGIETFWINTALLPSMV